VQVSIKQNAQSYTLLKSCACNREFYRNIIKRFERNVMQASTTSIRTRNIHGFQTLKCIACSSHDLARSPLCIHKHLLSSTSASTGSTNCTSSTSSANITSSTNSTSSAIVVTDKWKTLSLKRHDVLCETNYIMRCRAFDNARTVHFGAWHQDQRIVKYISHV
jgi:hypothetical protein